MREYSLKAQIWNGPTPSLLCLDENGLETIIPVEYTNFGKTRLCDIQPGSEICFAYDDLRELKNIVDSINNMSSKLCRNVK